MSSRDDIIKDLAQEAGTDLTDDQTSALDKQLSHEYVDSLLDGAPEPFTAAPPLVQEELESND